MDSITTHVNVHTTGHEVPIECQTLVPDSGEPFTLLTIGPVSLYATPDQLRQLRDVIIEFLVQRGDRGGPLRRSGLGRRRPLDGRPGPWSFVQRAGPH